MSKKFGLPTFPIYDGMFIGDRPADELEWLLAHGTFQSETRNYYYYLIFRVDADEYCIVKCKDASPAGPTSGAGTLQKLLEVGHLDISGWYWYGDSELDDATP